METTKYKKLHIRKGDTVLVLNGNDKGHKGRVISVYPVKQRALVEGVAMVTRHTKPNAAHPEGGRIEKEAPVHISKLMLVEPKSGKPSRTRRKKNSKGNSVRVTLRSGEELK